MADIETQENETVSLVLEISKPRKVTWLKNGQEVVASDRFQISISEDGLRHVLTLKDVTKEEMAEFTASIDDASYGVITSSCKVNVVGKSISRYKGTNVKVKFSHTRYRALGPELIPVTDSQPAGDLLSHPLAVGAIPFRHVCIFTS